MTLKQFIATGRAVLDCLYDGVVIADREGKVLYVNPANARITGMAREEAEGRYVAEVVPQSHILNVLKTGSPLVDVPTRVGERVVISNIMPVKIDGEMLGVISVFRDLTETLNLHRKLQDAKDIISGLRRQLDSGAATGLSGMVAGRNRAMQKIMHLAAKAAQVNSTVLIQGESGTGKEMLARFIHSKSARSEGAFIAVDCAAIPESLLESELFGYEEGAFTGARRGGKPGMLELAHGGTLFLDEVENLSLLVQAKLLRVLQFREITRVGGVRSRQVDVQVMAASNKNLEEMVARREFREDLFYRLNVIRMEIPPLRQRQEDMPLFIAHILGKLREKIHKQAAIGPDAMKLLLAYPYPGNVRELENILELALVADDDEIITAADLPEHIARYCSGTDGESSKLKMSFTCFPSLAEMERTVMLLGLESFPVKSSLAQALGISRATLYRKLKEYGLIDESVSE